MRRQTVQINYTNWKGERRTRLIQPFCLVFRASQWHGDQPTWILEALDVEDDKRKDFAMTGIYGWTTPSE